MENFYAVVRQLKAYQCVREISRNAVCVQAWAETMRVVFRNLGVTATHQGRSRTPLTVHVNMTKASGDASATNADTKTPVHCAVRASAVRRICASSHDSFEPNHKCNGKKLKIYKFGRKCCILFEKKSDAPGSRRCRGTSRRLW